MAIKREKVIKAAEKYVARGKLEAAINEYRKVIRESPNDINTLNKVGDLYARIEKYDEAVRLFSQIADQYSRDGFFVKAIAIFKKIIKLDPTALQVYERLAELYHRQGLLNEARTQYQVLADYYSKHENATSAITIYQRMAEMEPDNPAYRLKLAELYSSQRLVDKALTEYRVLADLMLVNGSVDEAAQVYSTALEVAPENLDFIREAVISLNEGGHVGAAAKVLSKASELNPAAAELSSLIAVPEPQAAAPIPSGPGASLEVDPSAVPEVGLVADGGMAEGVEPLEPTADAYLDSQADFYPEAGDPDSSSGVGWGGDSSVGGHPVDGSSAPADSASAGFEQELSFDSSGYGDAGVGFGGTAWGQEAEPNPDTGVGSAPGGLYAEPSQEFAGGPEAFTFDLDDDEIPPTQVLPPDDMQRVEGEGGEEDFEFEIELELDEGDSGTFEAGGLGEGSSASASPQELPGSFKESDLVDPDFGEDTLLHAGSGEAPSAEPPADLPPPTAEEPPTFEVEWGLETMGGLEVELPATAQMPGDLDPSVVAEPPAEAFPNEDSASSAIPVEDVSSEDVPSDDVPVEDVPSEIPPLPDLEPAPFELSFDLDDEPETEVRPSASEPAAAAFELEPAPMPAAAPPPPVPAPPAASAPAAASAPVDSAPPAVRREEDLLAEARVFAKYGLKEKAIDRLDDLLTSHGDHAEALMLRIRLDLEGGEPNQIIERANRLSELSARRGEREFWLEIQPELEKAGFMVEGDRVLTGTVAKPAEDDRIAQLLEDLSLESFEGTVSAVSPPLETLIADGADPAPGASPLPPELEAPPAGQEAASSDSTAGGLASEMPEPGPPPSPGFSLAEALATEGLDEGVEPAVQGGPDIPVEGATEAEISEAGMASMDETGMSWLDEPTPEPDSQQAASQTIFDEEDDFFDLAAELEAELGEGASSSIDEGMLTSVESQEQSLEEIIEGFKQGVAENLSPEDYDTHFNLGIAYREMGLMDEAIGEFQLASKDPRYLVECASMLGICFQEKGHLELSVRWYQKGLAAPDISEEATLGLLYDMGDSYVTMGDTSSAYKTFVEVYGMNSNFRDVSARLQELAPQ